MNQPETDHNPRSASPIMVTWTARLSSLGDVGPPADGAARATKEARMHLRGWFHDHMRDDGLVYDDDDRLMGSPGTLFEDEWASRWEPPVLMSTTAPSELEAFRAYLLVTRLNADVCLERWRRSFPITGDGPDPLLELVEPRDHRVEVSDDE